MADSCSTSHQCPSVPPTTYSEKTGVECVPCKCVSQYSCIETVSSGFPYEPKKPVEKLNYEKAKEILQKPSSLTEENLFDHLVEVIKRIIDERPTNVIDYFEQFSRDVRKKKPYFGDRSSDPCDDVQFVEIAVAILRTLRFLPPIEEAEYIEEGERDYAFSTGESMTVYSESSILKMPRELSPNENVIQLQHLWAFCGLGFHIDEVFQLSWSMQRIQNHRLVKNARFWGKIYGLKGSYYVVEALLSNTEIEIRFEAMKANLLAKMEALVRRRNEVRTIIDPELIPGFSWQVYPQKDLERMVPAAGPIPVLIIPESFEAPPEPVGIGVNRRTYFVTTSLSGEWQELPIVTAQQIKISRKIKKYLTGNLNANLSCYPLFPGTEKHYLRAIIARITAGTYIAPGSYYRRMTKREIKEFYGDLEEMEEEGEGILDEEAEEEDISNNDAMLIENELYEPFLLEDLTNARNWVHVRPNILDQGRVIHMDEELAIRDLEKKAVLKIRAEKRMVYADQEEEEDEENGEENELMGEEEEVEEERPPPEIGPELFTSCIEDENDEYALPWIARYSSVHNKTNQMIMMRSSLWPGAYTFTFEKFCDSIYLGWGNKYVSRNISLDHIPITEDIDCADTARETLDPTPEMEEKWRRYYMKKPISLGEEMSDISIDFDIDDKEDE